MAISEEARWRAVVQNDARYDGCFFYGVKTTGVFCRPSCNSRVPRREHVLYFYRAEEALRVGYRPCKRCRPDLPSFEPDCEVVREVKQLLEHRYQRSWTLRDLSPNMWESAPGICSGCLKNGRGFLPTST